MIKNIVTDADEILSRVNNLTSQSKAVWGSLTVKSMLNHCIITNRRIIEATPSGKEVTLKQKMLKYLIMYVFKKLPKGIKGNPKFFLPDGGEDGIEGERQLYLEVIREFEGLNKELVGDHPVFGRLNTEEWRQFVYLHMDHHLRQFGV